MKKVVFAFIIAIMATSGIFAQQLNDVKNIAPDQRADKLTEIVSTQLDFNAEQTAALKEFNLYCELEIQTLLEQDQLNKEQLETFASLQQMREDKLESIMGLGQANRYKKKKYDIRAEYRQFLMSAVQISYNTHK